MELREMIATVLGTHEPKRLSDVEHALNQKCGDSVWHMTKHRFMEVVEAIDGEVADSQAAWDKTADCGRWCQACS